MSFTSSSARKLGIALSTMICLGLPMTGNAEAVMEETPSDSFSLADGSVRKGKIVGDKLFIVGRSGKLEAAPDGVYARGGASFKVERGIVVQSGSPVLPGVQKGIVVQNKGVDQAPKGQ